MVKINTTTNVHYARSGDFEIGIGLGVIWHVGQGPVNAELAAKVMEMYQFDGDGKYTGGGIKVNGSFQGNAGALSAEAEKSVPYFVNRGSKSPGLTIQDGELSAGLKFPKKMKNEVAVHPFTYSLSLRKFVHKKDERAIVGS